MRGRSPRTSHVELNERVVQDPLNVERAPQDRAPNLAGDAPGTDEVVQEGGGELAAVLLASSTGRQGDRHPDDGCDQEERLASEHGDHRGEPDARHGRSPIQAHAELRWAGAPASASRSARAERPVQSRVGICAKSTTLRTMFCPDPAPSAYPAVMETRRAWLPSLPLRRGSCSSCSPSRSGSR